jgi:stearoyl-CoA desaturase (delta-9 desaturase)
MLDTMINFLSHGLVKVPIWAYLVIALVTTHITIASVTIFLHRHQAHRALDLHPLISHFFRFWLWLTTGMVTAQWVAVHRKHHAKCEKADDPHSPWVLGIRKVLWQGAELYKREARRPETLLQYAHGTPDDWLERKLYTPHCLLGVSALLVLYFILFGAIGVTLWAIQMLWIPFWAAGVINGLGHWWGYRNFESRDRATNISPVGILIGGEELHNNHHAFPASAKLSVRWWEFDIGWFYIQALKSVGLAKVKKVAPRPVILAEKQSVDLETVRAVIVSRLHVMAQYARDVLVPVLRDEWQCAGDSCRHRFRQARRILVRESSLMDDVMRARLDGILAISQRLRTVYQFRQGLQSIWAERAANQAHLIKALQEWCAQAEVTGIQALEDFALRLRGYSLASA